MTTKSLDNASVALLPALLNFYSEHFAKIDEGDVRAWADDFTNDAEFVSPAVSLASRDAIRAASAAALAQRVADGIQQRHLQTSVRIVSADEPTIEVRSYVLVVTSRKSGDPTGLLSTVVVDRIVVDRIVVDVPWQIQRREITFDGR